MKDKAIIKEGTSQNIVHIYRYHIRQRSDEVPRLLYLE